MHIRVQNSQPIVNDRRQYTLHKKDLYPRLGSREVVDGSDDTSSENDELLKPGSSASSGDRSVSITHSEFMDCSTAHSRKKCWLSRCEEMPDLKEYPPTVTFMIMRSMGEWRKFDIPAAKRRRYLACFVRHMKYPRRVCVNRRRQMWMARAAHAK